MATTTTSTCKQCSKEFELTLSDKNRGRGSFCSRPCLGKHQKGIGNPAYKHGNAKRSRQTKEYRTWAGIKARCYNPNEQNASYYLGRGIKMHESWVNDFEQFLKDVGYAPSQQHSIDRIDVNGNYEPGNVRWATMKEQMNNMRKNVIFEYRGEIKTIAQWANSFGVTYNWLYSRIRRGQYSLKDIDALLNQD